MAPEDLEILVNRIDELDRLIVRSFIEWDPEKLSDLLVEFDRAKRDVQTHLIEYPSVQLIGPDSAKARAILGKISAGENLPVEDAFIGKFMDVGLDETDLEEIGTQELYSWMCHVDYARGLFKAGALIVNCGALPANLKDFLHETRQCFAFQQYNAVAALCRTMIEVAARDIAARCKPPQGVSGNVLQFNDERHKSLNEIINSVTHRPEFSHLREPLHRLRQSANPIVHGGRTVDETVASQTLRETLRVIRQLYEVEISVVA